LRVSPVADDVVATIDDKGGPTFQITMAKEEQSGSMMLNRLVAEEGEGGECSVPKTTQTSTIDGGTVYGTDANYLSNVLREPGSCKLRTSEGNMPPMTTTPDEKGRFFFLTGDLRVDEHAVLTAMHTIWMREHNRLCDEISREHPDWSADQQFDLARKVHNFW
jgi:hypothetical protein